MTDDPWDDFSGPPYKQLAPLPLTPEAEARLEKARDAHARALELRRVSRRTAPQKFEAPMGVTPPHSPPVAESDD